MGTVSPNRVALWQFELCGGRNSFPLSATCSSGNRSAPSFWQEADSPSSAVHVPASTARCLYSEVPSHSNLLAYVPFDLKGRQWTRFADPTSGILRKKPGFYQKKLAWVNSIISLLETLLLRRSKLVFSLRRQQFDCFLSVSISEEPTLLRKSLSHLIIGDRTRNAPRTSEKHTNFVTGLYPNFRPISFFHNRK